MKHGSSGRRSRGRGGSGRRGNNKTQVFDSNGPDVRIRGTAHQVFEKYMALAKDASGVGDMILAESYTQHAEHYKRIINNWEDVIENNGRSRDDEEFEGDISDAHIAAQSTRTAKNSDVSRELEQA